MFKEAKAPLYLFDRKLLLLAIYLAFDYRAIGARLADLGLSFSLVAYLGLYIALAGALLAAAYIPRTVPRIAVAILFTVASIGLQSYEWATHAPLDYNAFETMFASRGDAGAAFAQYGQTLLEASLAGLVLFLALALPPKREGLPMKLHWAMPTASIVAIALMLYVRGGEGTRALPAPFAPIAQAGIKLSLQLTEEGGPRKTVSFAPVSKSLAQDVVLIVDESVAAEYLDINSPGGVHSGLAEQRQGIAIYNYGVAASVTNCSAGSNKTLRFGGTRENYRSVGRIEPSVWAYAHKAGLRTVYLDGQRYGGQLQNLATEKERAEIDDFIQLGGTPVLQRDQVLARVLADHLNNDIPEFIYVNKIGAHFPVADKFPESAAKFRPLPPRGATSDVIDMGPVHGNHEGTAEEWRLYRNAYRNTIIWNVGNFFDYLLPRVDASKAVILYTSDHGQDLHERGNSGKATHCVADPHPEEGAVPLVVIDNPDSPRLDWQAHLAANRDGLSHFRIFPTLLALMGYGESDAKPLYGPTIAAAAPDDGSFTINYFSALGREPTWRKVDPQELIQPPASDFAQMALHED